MRRYNSVVQGDSTSFISDIIETEVLSAIAQAEKLLPEECAKVFRLHFEGWNVKEIAQQLGKSPSTVYAQKQAAINILKKKLSLNNFSIIYLFF